MTVIGHQRIWPDITKRKITKGYKTEGMTEGKTDKGKGKSNEITHRERMKD